MNVLPQFSKFMLIMHYDLNILDIRRKLRIYTASGRCVIKKKREKMRDFLFANSARSSSVSNESILSRIITVISFTARPTTFSTAIGSRPVCLARLASVSPKPNELGLLYSLSLFYPTLILVCCHLHLPLLLGILPIT